MNYYKQIAEMLGLELEQEFVLTDDCCFADYRY